MTLACASLSKAASCSFVNEPAVRARHRRKYRHLSLALAAFFDCVGMWPSWIISSTNSCRIQSVSCCSALAKRLAPPSRVGEAGGETGDVAAQLTALTSKIAELQAEVARRETAERAREAANAPVVGVTNIPSPSK